MNYSDTIALLYRQLPAYQNIGKKALKKDLTNIRLLCQALGHPERQFKSIHIAGTNGKGSTAHMLSSVFMEAGYQTGLYTSPHLVDFRERIKINGQLIHKNTVIAFVKKIRPVMEEIRPSFFEITVAMAFYHFASKKVDIAIIETGLGGRLDSTNIIRPELSIITNIALEHQHILGDTLELIAGEKAGIIKQKIPVVIGSFQKETYPVFQQTAKLHHAQLFLADKMFHVTKVKHHISHTNYSISDSYKNKINYSLDLKGHYQRFNLITVLAALEVVKAQKNFTITAQNVKNGLANIRLNSNFTGRWQQLQNEPDVIVDCAHNAAGIKSIFDSDLMTHYDNIKMVYGCVKDKDLSAILTCLPSHADYYITQPSVERAKPAKELAAAFINANMNVAYMNSSPLKALKKAIKAAGKKDIVLVIGSVFLVADVLRDI